MCGVYACYVTDVFQGVKCLCVCSCARVVCVCEREVCVCVCERERAQTQNLIILQGLSVTTGPC